MSSISMLIYGGAALWAVQSLIGLMVRHRKVTLARLQREEIARQTAAAIPVTSGSADNAHSSAPAPSAPATAPARTPSPANR